MKATYENIKDVKSFYLCLQQNCSISGSFFTSALSSCARHDLLQTVSPSACKSSAAIIYTEDFMLQLFRYFFPISNDFHYGYYLHVIFEPAIAGSQL